jgi:RNA polymerase sigma-70 factor (ECF subfamily)
MLLQSSRLTARLDSQGALVPLPRQDRARWNHERIAAGLEALARAGQGIAASEFHLLAGIAACHASAASHETTDWRRIVALYDRLAGHKKSFVIDISRAIAVAQLDGPQAGLALLDGIDDGRSEDYHLLAAARAEMLSDTGEGTPARTSYERAAALAPSAAERRYFLRRAEEQEVEGI